VKNAGVKQRKVLSKAAKRLIKKDVQSGSYTGQIDAREPPLMPPLIDERQYSMVGDHCFGLYTLLSDHSGTLTATTFAVTFCYALGLGSAFAPVVKHPRKNA
jgi:hypothetical protein